jgi:cysteine desulfurase / selenocysteine lyase
MTPAKAAMKQKPAAPGRAPAQKRGAPAAGAYDVAKVRAEFPILSAKVHGKPLVYLDNAATTQKPRQVIERIRSFYEAENANIHRGVHHLSEVSTKAYEASRAKVASFLGAAQAEEVVFTRGATEAINLVAAAFARPRLQKGDEVVLTEMEHHSNIVPWQLAAQATGASIKVVPILDDGSLDMAAYERVFTKRTRMAALSHVSNALGTVNPVREMVRIAHGHGVPVLLDGAQAVPHTKVDVRALGADFYAASGHKMYGPTGIGFLYARREHLEAMPPWQGGGDMIRSVSFAKTTYNDVPYKFEAGTPHIEGGIGLAPAIDYLAALGIENVAAHEHRLLEHATDAVGSIEGVRVIGTAREKAAVLSFHVEGVHPHDIGSLLDRDGIAIRTGHHCAQPVMERYGVPATNRASFGLYNTEEEVDALAESLRKVVKLFR